MVLIVCIVRRYAKFYLGCSLWKLTVEGPGFLVEQKFLISSQLVSKSLETPTTTLSKAAIPVVLHGSCGSVYLKYESCQHKTLTPGTICAIT